MISIEIVVYLRLLFVSAVAVLWFIRVVYCFFIVVIITITVIITFVVVVCLVVRRKFDIKLLISQTRKFSQNYVTLYYQRWIIISI